MRTKYRVSVENTYLGPIASVPESLFDELVNTSTQTDQPSNNDDNNNPNQNVFVSQSYECLLKSSTKGEMRLYAGHHKHAFTTCNRSITCKVIKGQMKVKCGSQKWTVTENNTIKLNPNTTYFVKNNSLRNECIILFSFESN